jgi:hypothetical protein
MAVSCSSASILTVPFRRRRTGFSLSNTLITWQVELSVLHTSRNINDVILDWVWLHITSALPINPRCAWPPSNCLIVTW